MRQISLNKSLLLTTRLGGLDGVLVSCPLLSGPLQPVPCNLHCAWLRIAVTETPIAVDVIPWSVRTAHVLQRAGIGTLADLARADLQTLQASTRHCGPTTTREIALRLADYLQRHPTRPPMSRLYCGDRLIGQLTPAAQENVSAMMADADAEACDD